MSARDELYNELRQWCSKTEMEWFTSVLDAYQDEILREAAEKIRMAGSHPSLVGVRREVSEDYNAAADLIDPEVKS